jgi:hypothetical protein
MWSCLANVKSQHGGSLPPPASAPDQPTLPGESKPAGNMAPSQSRRPTGRSAGGSLPSSSARNPTQRSVPANRRSGAFRPASPPAASSVRATPQESIVPGAEAGEARDQDDDVDDDLCQVVMAVDMREGLYILEDVQLGGREVIETRTLSRPHSLMSAESDFRPDFYS